MCSTVYSRVNETLCQTAGSQKQSNVTEQPSGAVWLRKLLSGNPFAVNNYTLWLKCKQQLLKGPGM